METKMEKNYDHSKVEEGKFDSWKNNGYFKASGDLNDTRPVFSMILPPPNVSGVLHVGHALGDTIQGEKSLSRRLISGKKNPLPPSTNNGKPSVSEWIMIGNSSPWMKRLHTR